MFLGSLLLEKSVTEQRPTCNKLMDVNLLSAVDAQMSVLRNDFSYANLTVKHKVISIHQKAVFQFL